MFVVLFYAVLAVVAALVNDTSRPIAITFVINYHWLGLAAAAIVPALLLFPCTRQRVQSFTVRGRIALVIFVGAPLLIVCGGPRHLLSAVKSGGIPTRNLLGFLGAYFFSFQMLFRRFVRRDLSSNAYVAASMRIIMAVLERDRNGEHLQLGMVEPRKPI